MVKDSGVYAVVLEEIIVYVGSSVNIYNRIKAHKSALSKNKHHSPYWQNVYNKYGDIFEFVLLELTPKDQLIQREQFYIDHYKPKFNVNPKAGSRLGSKQSPEAIEKTRQAHLGKARTEETKQRISAAQKGILRGKGYKHTDEAKTKMKVSMADKKALGIKRNRKPMTQETKDKIRMAQQGVSREYAKKPRTEETKRKISEAQKGVPRLYARKKR